MTEHYLNGAKWKLKNEKAEYEGILDENGSANLKNIAWGRYTFTLSKDGYEKQEDTIIVDDNPIDIQVDLKPKPKKAKKSSKKTSNEKETTTKKTKKSGAKTSRKTKKTTKKTEVKEETTGGEEKKE